jgi:hypothetical protein
LYVYMYMIQQALTEFGGTMAILSVLALLLLAVTMGLSLAHALEFPGKLRLDEPTYRAVQAIYYPGFTIGGLVGEFGGLLALIVLLASGGPPRHLGSSCLGMRPTGPSHTP